MFEIFHPKVSVAQDIDEVRLYVVQSLHEIKKTKPKIGVVSGIISSDGPDKIAYNLDQLSRRKDLLEKELDFPVFSSRDIFTDEVYSTLFRNGILPESEFYFFWRQVYTMSELTDVFMTPGWRRSKGCRDEYETSKRAGLAIHDLENGEYILPSNKRLLLV